MQKAFFLAAGLVAFGAGFALAQVQSRFALADADQDGLISRAEWLTRARSDFQALDMDGDSALSAEERQAQLGEERAALRARLAARQERQVGPALAGPMSLEDFEARASARFDRIDADGDGLVTVAELQAIRPAVQTGGGAQ